MSTERRLSDLARELIAVPSFWYRDRPHGISSVGRELSTEKLNDHPAEGNQGGLSMNTPSMYESKGRANSWDVLLKGRGFVVAAACLLLLAACGPRADGTFVSAPDKGVTVENISANPADYIGKQVTVVAPIRRTYGENAFSLFAENLPDDLLAVGADPYPDQQNENIETSLIQAKTVRVTGVVRRFDTAAIEREAGIKLDDERLKPYLGKPVIVVKSIP